MSSDRSKSSTYPNIIIIDIKIKKKLDTNKYLVISSQCKIVMTCELCIRMDNTELSSVYLSIF